MLVTIQNMMLLFSPCKRCPCPCSDAVLRSSCEEALAGIILHRPPSLWFAWVRSGCAGPLQSRGPGVGGRTGGGDTMIPWGGGAGGVTHLVLNDELQELSGRQGADPFRPAAPAQKYPNMYVCLHIYLYIYIYTYIYIYCIMSNM